jgi:hypothetical protein
MSRLSASFNSIQKWLFPVLEDEIGELSEKMRQFVSVVDMLDLPSRMSAFRGVGRGRPPHDRMSIFKAFIFKAVYNHPTTKAMLEHVKSSPPLRRLCGWETAGMIPSESSLSRALAQFSGTDFPSRVHACLVDAYLGDKLAGHVSRDSTAIEAREKAFVDKVVAAAPAAPASAPAPAVASAPATPAAPAAAAPRRRGRPRKGVAPAEPEPTRIERQKGRTLEENLADLPTRCDWGAKRDSKGKSMAWKGYKLHIDTIDGDIPVGAVLTSASMHDSQAAIPMMQMTSGRITYLYDLMDSAYDATDIHGFSRSLNHVPVIDHNPRRGGKIEFEPARKIRYRERSAAERVNSDLKDNHGGRTVRVRGHGKVLAHLMFGLIVITVNQMFKMLC